MIGWKRPAASIINRGLTHAADKKYRIKPFQV